MILRWRHAPPVGSMVMSAAPADGVAARRVLAFAGWLVCDGKARPTRATAPELFAAIGYTYGRRDPIGFAIPDLRGQFLRVQADGPDQDPGWDLRVAPSPDGDQHGVGSTQPDMVQKHEHRYDQATSSSAQAGGGTAAIARPMQATTDLLDAGGTRSLSGDETRPTNTYVVVLIRFSSRVGLRNLVVDLGLT